jgi:hypothetical protein
MNSAQKSSGRTRRGVAQNINRWLQSYAESGFEGL